MLSQKFLHTPKSWRYPKVYFRSIFALPFMFKYAFHLIEFCLLCFIYLHNIHLCHQFMEFRFIGKNNLPLVHCRVTFVLNQVTVKVGLFRTHSSVPLVYLPIPQFCFLFLFFLSESFSLIHIRKHITWVFRSCWKHHCCHCSSAPGTWESSLPASLWSLCHLPPYMLHASRDTSLEFPRPAN